MNRAMPEQADAERSALPSANGTNGHTSSPSPNGANGAAPNGRAEGGRFAKGNPGGPGNPFARRVAALRTALLDAVTPERMHELAAQLHARAVAGDMAAAKLLLAYTVGEPGPAVDPDRIELDAISILLRSPDFADVWALRWGEDCRPVSPAHAALLIDAGMAHDGAELSERIMADHEERQDRKKAERRRRMAARANREGPPPCASTARPAESGGTS